MTCRELENRLSAYLDQELEATDRQDVERHLRECQACETLHARQRALGAALRAQLPTFTAPDLLRARIENAIRENAIRDAHAAPDTTHALRATRRWRWAAIAASALFVLSAGYGTFATLRETPPRSDVTQEVLAGHIRSLMPGHLTDVASTNRHTVKPWFSGRLDYSPPVYDLAAQGFPLVGGRLDYVDGRPVAALVYRHEQHMINLFVWPEAREGAGARERSWQGFQCLHWTNNGMTYWLVSELNGETLRDFERAHKQMETAAAATNRE